MRQIKCEGVGGEEWRKGARYSSIYPEPDTANYADLFDRDPDPAHCYKQMFFRRKVAI